MILLNGGGERGSGGRGGGWGVGRGDKKEELLP